MNELDSKANSRAIGQPRWNYETVKYFGNEHYEAERYDQSLQRWEKAAVRRKPAVAAESGAEPVYRCRGDADHVAGD